MGLSTGHAASPDRSEQVIYQPTLDKAAEYLVKKFQADLQNLGAEPITQQERFYVTQSPHHIIVTDGEGFSCYGGRNWQMQNATFCICFNTKARTVESVHIDPAHCK
ncbi:MAG: hypothetical protein J5J00_07335 [Deltaproteobacteria bacterium]|nr:hypothetical protein [Deltaproteobacteria bacterium]